MTWRGVRLDDRSAAMMDEVTLLVPDVPVTPTQGSYSGGVSASAGTHDGGGAIDLAAADLTGGQRDQLVAAMRQVGWAAWLRTPYQSDWPWHVHGVAVACADLSRGAQDQVDDYMAGYNGLASHGPDDGPRDWVGVTWETYQEDDMTPTQAQQLAEVHAVLFAGSDGTPLDQTVYQRLLRVEQVLFAGSDGTPLDLTVYQRLARVEQAVGGAG